MNFEEVFGPMQSVPARHDEYRAWIEANTQREPHLARGTCDEETARLCGAFPELRRARGHYICSSWGQQQHWWCVAPDGRVVDPTAVQFPSNGQGFYSVIEDEADLPVGVCMDCGAEVYLYEVDDEGTRTGKENAHAPTFCNERCEIRTRAYLERPTVW